LFAGKEVSFSRRKIVDNFCRNFGDLVAKWGSNGGQLTARETRCVSVSMGGERDPSRPGTNLVNAAFLIDFETQDASNGSSNYKARVRFVQGS
jgi:hypothetical protein